jgi:phosphoribosylglycinamide formyltransferase-1
MASESRCRIAVLISGSGSNLQAIIEQGLQPDSPYQVCAVISNRPDVGGLQRATAAGIDTVTIDHKTFPDRESFDQALAQCIEGFNPELVVLAGFMRILTAGFVSQLRGRLLNIHPSLLPKYPGLHTHQRALDAGDNKAGCTVHFVTEELDGGPPLLQASVPISSTDNAEQIAQKVLVREHQIYPLAVRWFAEGRFLLAGDHALLDGEKLGPSGFIYQD